MGTKLQDEFSCLSEKHHKITSLVGWPAKELISYIVAGNAQAFCFDLHYYLQGKSEISTGTDLKNNRSGIMTRKHLATPLPWHPLRHNRLHSE